MQNCLPRQSSLIFEINHVYPSSEIYHQYFFFQKEKEKKGGDNSSFHIEGLQNKKVPVEQEDVSDSDNGRKPNDKDQPKEKKDSGLKEKKSMRY